MDRDYLTYGYDEFGNDLHDLYKDLEDTGIPNPYSRQGKDQPFGYTGYRHDEISGTYFAQAREYQPQNGRFTAQDVIKGNGAYPETLNWYGYCWGNPVGLVDLDGLYPAWLYGIYAHLQFEAEFLAYYYKDVGSMARENTYGDVNVYIPGGGRTGDKGFADLVLYNEGAVEIYEIKPISCHETGEGKEQLDRYIQAYGFNNRDVDVKEGSIENVEVLLWWNETFAFNSEMNITYEMFEDSPGMIYYTFNDKKPEKQPGYVKQPIQYAELDEDLEKSILYRAGEALIAEMMAGASLEKGLNTIANKIFPILILPEDIIEHMFRYSGGDCPMV